MDIERKAAYFDDVLMGCANYKKGTDEFAGFQVTCDECVEIICPFKNNTPTDERESEACINCGTIHNQNKCPECRFCWVCDA